MPKGKKPKKKLNVQVNMVFVPVSRNVLTLAARLEGIASDLLAAIPLKSSLIDCKAIAKQLTIEHDRLNYFERQVKHEVADRGKK